MSLRALLALDRVRLRRGDPGVAEVLDEAQAMAAPSGTLQRLGPSCAARAEAAFARGDLAAVRAEVAAASPLAQAKRYPWFSGDLVYWQWRAGVAAESALSLDCHPPRHWRAALPMAGVCAALRITTRRARLIMKQ